MNLDLLRAMPAALVGSMNNDLLDQLMHDLRGKLRNMLIFLYCPDKSSHGNGQYGNANLSIYLDNISDVNVNNVVLYDNDNNINEIHCLRLLY